MYIVLIVSKNLAENYIESLHNLLLDNKLLQEKGKLCMKL